jgi:hypothetical protein
LEGHFSDVGEGTKNWLAKPDGGISIADSMPQRGIPASVRGIGICLSLQRGSVTKRLIWYLLDASEERDVAIAYGRVFLSVSQIVANAALETLEVSDVKTPELEAAFAYIIDSSDRQLNEHDWQWMDTIECQVSPSNGKCRSALWVNQVRRINAGHGKSGGG